MTGVQTCALPISYNENKPSEEDEVTVTFDAGDGTPVAPITVKKGETISRLPAVSYTHLDVYKRQVFCEMYTF